MKIRISILVIILSHTALLAQENPLMIQSDIRLPKDSFVKTLLVQSLNGFLARKDQPVEGNPFILKQDRLETSVLLEEFKDIGKSVKNKQDNFFKPYLTNLVRLYDSAYLIQLSYIGVTDSTPYLRACFTLIANRIQDRFYFSSPLRLNAKSWKTRKIGWITFHYKDQLNITNAKKYEQMVTDFDRKLNAPKIPTSYYSCDNFHEALQLSGIDYKADYNGYRMHSLSGKDSFAHLNVNGIFTSGFKDVDPHDLWHSRLHLVVSPSLINRPVDEGTAYLYGGSWGLTWKQILQKFKVFADLNPDADWLALYNESKNFDEGSKFPLNVDFVINALLVQKLEKEKGFPAVIELLSCGNKVKDNENYFTALERLTGIGKSDFKKEIGKLIREAME